MPSESEHEQSRICCCSASPLLRGGSTRPPNLALSLLDRAEVLLSGSAYLPTALCSDAINVIAHSSFFTPS
jgi:hypothetical protein